ncbi:MAG: hypothetical protein ABIO45_05760 [Burkholderiaceae bacterium]
MATLAKETIELCAKAAASHRAGQGRLAKNQVDSATAKIDEMNAIVTSYIDADNKNKSYVKDNPVHSTILKFVGTLTARENQALKAVQATQATQAGLK